MAFRSSSQIRQDFLDFFAKKGHVITPSAPVVPKDDPTLLFTNAGMNQFKPIFLGDQTDYEQDGKRWARAANTQKCIRVSGKHNDLEEVGIDTYHHTLFEMLGNWSFGNYFKKEAIEWAWELLIDVWGLEENRIYVTVFGGDEEDGLPVDEEAIELWKDHTKIKPNRILKFGKKDNFWEMGDTGPCGPCSEIHIDLRPDEDRARVDGATLVNADDPRVMEIWNLVFIQFNRNSDGTLKTLPAQHVDTGMGFERICAVIQGQKSNYDSDVFEPLLSSIQKLSGLKYGSDEKTDIAMRVIADHARAISFGIADGASPSNDGRGYVIRRILRRAIRYGWDVLNLKKPFIYKLADVLGQQFESVFPELQAQLAYVKSVIKAEEESFLRTLGNGIVLFNELASRVKEISGEDAFKLHDTYGFPIDLTRLMARERNISVDESGFETLMQEQKERARNAGKFAVSDSGLSEWVTVANRTLVPTNFCGYDSLTSQSSILAYRTTGDGRTVQVVFDQTPLYAESGGQVSDSGYLEIRDTDSGHISIPVLDVQKKDDLFIHTLPKLPASPENSVRIVAEKKTRLETQKHHTATHLLHAALREVLGTHVTQKGSLVNQHKLRFDFSHFEALSQNQLDEIEIIVNEKIQENISLSEERDVPVEEARKRGAMMLFGEKYGNKVRVITFDPTFSVELCGGTHVKSTGEIGYFRIVSESSVAAGIRRIEAVGGMAADALLRKEKETLQELAAVCGNAAEPIRYISVLAEEKKQLEKELQKLKMNLAASKLESILSTGESLGDDTTLIKAEIEGQGMNELKQLGYDLINRTGNGTIGLLSSVDTETSKVYLVVTVSEDLVNKGVKAGSLVGVLARKVGGGGGGQSNLATAGGKKPELLPDMLAEANEIVRDLLQKTQ
ncbi:MAG: alanine--tRNA ligase [Balneolales bacterium]|nr:alanine--tRNA ligase [Balneolales bacterium]